MEEGPFWTESQFGPGLTSYQRLYIVHMRLQFFPYNARLSPVLKLLCYPLVGDNDAGMILRQVDTEMLAERSPRRPTRLTRLSLAPSHKPGNLALRRCCTRR